MRGISLSWFNVHDAQGEPPGRDETGGIVLSGPTGTDETMLCSPVSVYLRVLECSPISLTVAEPGNVPYGNFLQGQIGDFRWPGMTRKSLHFAFLS